MSEKERKEQNTTIEIAKYPIKDTSSPNCPPNNNEGFLFLELPDINSLLYLGVTSSNTFGLYLFDIINSTWSKCELKGDIPSPMNYFAGWYDSPYLFIHGGKSLQENKSLKETYLIDISSMSINKIFTIEEPSSRYGHSAVKNNDKQAYIFGGCNIGKKNERYLNDLHKMEYKNISVFTDNNTNINGASWIVNIQTKGEKPPGRKGYCMQFIENVNSILIYGGELKDNKINDDGIYLYNIDEKEYKKLNIKENIIGCRAYHTMHLNDTINQIYVIGGINNNKEVLNDIIEVDMNDKDNITMNKKEGNDLLNKRYGHKGCNIFFSGENDVLYHHILILGGKKSENEFYDNSLIDIFIKNNTYPNDLNEKNNNNNFNNEENIQFDIEDLKDEDIEHNMDILLNNNNEKNGYNYNNDNDTDNENTLPLKITDDIIQNKRNPIPISNRTVYSNHNSNYSNSYNNNNFSPNNINNNDFNSNSSNYSIKNNLEIQKKKKNYLDTLLMQQKQYIEMYTKYQKVNEEYLTNINTLKELQNKELGRKIMENLNKNKNKGKMEKLGKLKGEVATYKKKMKDIKSYNELLNEYMNIYKERFCYLSDFLSDYIEDIMKLDNLLMEYGLSIPGVNYESFSNKRKRYKMLVINLCRDVKVYNIFEKDLYDKLVRLKEFEQVHSENNSYRNTIQKVNKKEETVNMNEYDN